MEKREKTYMRKRERIGAGRNPKPVTVSVGFTVRVDNDKRVCYDDNCVRRALVAQWIRRMEGRCKAVASVALDGAKPHPPSQLIVALMGLVAATPELCKIGGSRGTILK